MDRAFAYIDGFNLYYRVIRKQRLQWLDMRRMCELLVPSVELKQIKYFTARVSGTPDDPDRPIRQEVLLRALRTIPNLQIYFGIFRTHKVSMPIAGCGNSPTCFTKVFRTQEKGSDVNLAAHLLHDAHRGLFDVALVLSNDSDLVEPIRMVANDLGKRVGILSPEGPVGKRLATSGSFVRKVRPGLLAKCQFDEKLTDSKGEFRKPLRWTTPLPKKELRQVMQSTCPDCSTTLTCNRLVDAPTA